MSPVQPFLDFIARFESCGNYNAFFGDAQNQDAPRFTAMTLSEVLAWQEGRRFSACGKYQIIRKTLTGLIAECGLSADALYDEAMQERLALVLLERRGLGAFLAGEMAEEEFALSVAREWAALPGVAQPFGEASVYGADGVNKACVSSENYLSAIRRMKSAR